jgi:hypothetical protein
VLDPEPAAVQEIGLEGFPARTPASRKGSGKQCLDVTVVDPDTEPMHGTMPKHVGKGERPLIADQEHAPIGLVRLPEAVIGIVDKDGLPALDQRLHHVPECFVVEIGRE